MKRTTICVLLLALLCSLSACGESAQSSSAAPSLRDTQGTKAVAAVQPAQTPEAQSAEEEAQPAQTPQPDEPAQSAQEETAEAAFDAIPLIVTDEYSMTITSIDQDGLFGYTWNVLLENNTDQTLMFSLDDVSVNGIMCDPYWASSVAPGKKSNETVLWTDLSDYGIDTPTIISGRLNIYDDDTWDDLYDDTFTVTPYGEDAVTTVERDSQETDIPLLATDDYTVTITGISTDEWGYNWDLYLENNSQQDVMVTFDQVCVDGILCDPFWAESVPAGKKSSTTMTWYQDFSEYGITEPTIIEGLLNICDDDTYEDYYLDTFTVTPQGQDSAAYVVRQPQDTDQLLLDTDAVTVTYTGLQTDEYGDTVMGLYIENKTDAGIGLSIEDCSINGYMCDPYWAEELPANKVSYGEVNWYKDDLTQNGITGTDDITDISFTLSVYDPDTYEDLTLEPVTVNP